MAEKYIVDGATYCGKGNGPNIAAANDEDGAAWNNINVFTTGASPAYGTAPAAGDIVYIRSKNASSADITVSINSGSLIIGSSSATATAPISWVIDGGTKWSGINGTFTFTLTAASNYGVTLRANNWLKAENAQKLVFSQVGGSVEGTGTLCNLSGGCILENTLIDTSGNAASSYGAPLTGVAGSNNSSISRWRNCYLKVGSFYDKAIKNVSAYNTLEFVNCDIELTRTKTTEGGPLIAPEAQNLSKYRFLGGRIFGTGAASAHLLISLCDTIVELIGTQIPSFESVELFASSNGNYVNDSVRSFGADGKVGSEFWGVWGLISSRADNSPPTLNATLPNSAATPWSYLVYPKGITSQASLASGLEPCLAISKLYTSAAATKTVTLEFLLSTTVANANKKTVWMDVVYIADSDGLPRVVSTQAFTGTDALSSSSANWSVTSWGTKSFNKKNIAITTPLAIKQDTAVHVLFHYVVAAPNASDIAFVCPDVQLT